MIIKRFRQFALLLVLTVMLVGPAESQAAGGSPKTELPTVHHPTAAELEKLEPDVRQHLVSLRNSLAALAKDSATLSEAYGQMGRAYQAYSLNSPAKECYLNASRLAPKDYRWLYLLGNVSQQEGQVEEAIGYYLRTNELRPDYLAALVNSGNLHLQQNRLDAARLAFKSALAVSPQCAAAWYGLGQIALSNRNYAEAVENLDRALSNAREANRINYALAMAYRGLGKIEQARAALEKQGSVGVRVSDPLVEELQDLLHGERLHLLRGRMAFDALRYAEAAEAFRKAVAANPKSIVARVNLGAALAQSGKSSEAIEQYREVLRLSPNNATAHDNLELLLANPDSEDALLESVKLLLRGKQYSAAIEKLDKAHAQFPQNGRTAAMLAYLLAVSPQIELRDGTKALELAKLIYQSTGLINHGAIVSMALAELGRCAEAAEWQRKMIAVAEQNKQVGLAEKLKTDLQLYEKASPCRHQGEIIFADDRKL